jgi:hypothetical protein
MAYGLFDNAQTVCIELRKLLFNMHATFILTFPF